MDRFKLPVKNSDRGYKSITEKIGLIIWLSVCLLLYIVFMTRVTIQNQHPILFVSEKNHTLRYKMAKIIEETNFV